MTSGPGLPRAARELRTGRLLVATAAIEEPTFRRSVVLLLDHDEDGTLGVVTNRAGDIAVGTVLPDWQPHVAPPRVLFAGGPVAPDSALGLGLRRPGAEPVGFRDIGDENLGLVDLDTPPAVLADALLAMRVFAGYAGWAPGQLEAELAEGAWIVADAAPQDPFSARPDAQWAGVLRRQGGRLALLATLPDDVTLN